MSYKFILAGELRHSVTVQKPVETQNEFGEPEPSWKDFATLPACVEPLQGVELFQAQQVMPNVTMKVRTRFLAGVTPKHRLRFKGCGCDERVLNIEAVINPEERNRELLFMVKEAV